MHFAKTNHLSIIFQQVLTAKTLPEISPINSFSSFDSCYFSTIFIRFSITKASIPLRCSYGLQNLSEQSPLSLKPNKVAFTLLSSFFLSFYSVCYWKYSPLPSLYTDKYCCSLAPSVVLAFMRPWGGGGAALRFIGVSVFLISWCVTLHLAWGVMSSEGKTAGY